MSTCRVPFAKWIVAVRIVHTESSTVMGGQERRVLAESVGMRERGHEVWIATPPGGALADRAAEVGIDVIPMSFRRVTVPRSALNVASMVRRVRPDVLNSHSSALWPAESGHGRGR